MFTLNKWMQIAMGLHQAEICIVHLIYKYKIFLYFFKEMYQYFVKGTYNHDYFVR